MRCEFMLTVDVPADEIVRLGNDLQSAPRPEEAAMALMLERLAGWTVTRINCGRAS